MTHSYDLVIIGGTPGGVMCAIAAAREGVKKILLLERTAHVGGLCANGLGATDIATRGATEGLFKEFVDNIRKHYVDTYGPDSQQVRDCSGGYHFEPSIAEQILLSMLATQKDAITVLTMRQFDAEARNVEKSNARTVRAIDVLDRNTGTTTRYEGKVFVDATYEGDLAAAAGASFSTRREGREEYDETVAGRRYEEWHGRIDPASTFEGDDTIQAFNYRVCVTNDLKNSVPIPKPAKYDRNEYASIVDDVKQNRWAGKTSGELELDGIGRITNMVMLPNNKTDANNQHLAFVSTDLPEENYPWPTADWTWRDAFADRLRDYILGLFWFVQNDEELPADFRAKCRQWALSNSEYTDNGNFPRQVYVREGRRIHGEYLFTAHDAAPKVRGERPPILASSVTASHYALDSHAHRKREPGRYHLDGFLSAHATPYTVPFGVMVPKDLDNVLTPVPASATHIGFSTIRMEPCWMALGQAAGVAAALAIESQRAMRDLDVTTLQNRLLDQGAVLVYFKDTPRSHPHYRASQYFGLRGALADWNARLDEPATTDDSQKFAAIVGAPVPSGNMTRGELLTRLMPK